MGMTDINNAAGAQNALTARMNAFLDTIDADIATRQAAYAALSTNLAGVVGAQMHFVATVDPDEANPTNVDSGTFNTIYEAVAASPASSVVLLNLAGGKDHRIDASVPLMGRSLHVVSSHANHATIKQGTYDAGGFNQLFGFDTFHGGHLYVEACTIIPDGKANAANPWSAHYHSFVRAGAPDIFDVRLRGCLVQASEGYALATASYGSQVRMAGYSVTLDGDIFGVSNVASGAVISSLTNTTLLNGAAEVDGGTLGTNLLQN